MSVFLLSSSDSLYNTLGSCSKVKCTVFMTRISRKQRTDTKMCGGGGEYEVLVLFQQH